MTSERGARSMLLSSVRMSVVRSFVADTGSMPPSGEASSSGRIVTPSLLVSNAPAVVTTIAESCARIASSLRRPSLRMASQGRLIIGVGRPFTLRSVCSAKPGSATALLGSKPTPHASKSLGRFEDASGGGAPRGPIWFSAFGSTNTRVAPPESAHWSMA